jgi:hypothetical protein
MCHAMVTVDQPTLNMALKITLLFREFAKLKKATVALNGDICDLSLFNLCKSLYKNVPHQNIVSTQGNEQGLQVPGNERIHSQPWYDKITFVTLLAKKK